MRILTEIFSPTIVVFLIIIVGYFIGRIRLYGISLDLSAVLILAVFCGFVLSMLHFDGEESYMTDLQVSMTWFSSVGTSLFIAAVGLSAGYTFRRSIKKEVFPVAVISCLMVASSFSVMQFVGLLDTGMSRSALLGILCGALTSTPGMAAARELAEVQKSEIILGYGSSYLFGVLATVLFVQLLMKKLPKTGVSKAKKEKEGYGNSMIAIIQASVAIVFGSMLGRLAIFGTTISLGTSGGILCTAIFMGFLVEQYRKDWLSSNESLTFLRNIGLVFFFVGAGIPAGMELCRAFRIKWMLYGMIMTVIPIIIGYGLCSKILKKGNLTTACVISGGMTSTPAIGVLMMRNNEIPLSTYSVCYVTALLTMIVGIRFF